MTLPHPPDGTFHYLSTATLAPPKPKRRKRPGATTPQNLSLPTSLLSLYLSTPGLPLLSHLLTTAMRAQLEQAGIPADHPALAAPLPSSRTTAATTAAAAPPARTLRAARAAGREYMRAKARMEWE